MNNLSEFFVVWKKENVPHILQLRCAYLNGKLAI